jgi:hypothetical protein
MSRALVRSLDAVTVTRWTGGGRVGEHAGARQITRGHGFLGNAHTRAPQIYGDGPGQLIRNQQVLGSSPSAGSRFTPKYVKAKVGWSLSPGSGEQPGSRTSGFPVAVLLVLLNARRRTVTICVRLGARRSGLSCFLERLCATGGCARSPRGRKLTPGRVPRGCADDCPISRSCARRRRAIGSLKGTWRLLSPIRSPRWLCKPCMRPWQGDGRRSQPLTGRHRRLSRRVDRLVNPGLSFHVCHGSPESSEIFEAGRGSA